MGSPGSLTCPVETGVSVNIVQWDYYNSNNGAISEAINERYMYYINYYKSIDGGTMEITAINEMYTYMYM